MIGPTGNVRSAMLRVFKHYIPYAVLALGLIDLVALMFAGEIGWQLRAYQIAMDPGHPGERLVPLASFALSIWLAMVAVGAYSSEALLSVRISVTRLLAAISLGVIFLSLMNFLAPGATLWRSNSFYAMVAAIIIVIGLRIVVSRAIDTRKFRRRIVVLGAGKRAERIRLLAQRPDSGFTIAGLVAMNDGPYVVEDATPRGEIANLARYVVERDATEVVLALEERRNALPLDDLLRIKTTGVHVNDISSFFERETGRVDLDSVNPSWFIFSDGFTAGQRLSKFGKRVFDIVVSLVLLVLAIPLVALFGLAVKIGSSGPIFYRQQRVGLYGQPYDIIKLRSMRQDAESAGHAVWASQDDPRVTTIGRWMRKLRIDELPQGWCILKGDMSFVGPRPERPQFVDQLQARIPYYAERHMVKPGLTGWAQINLPYGASVEDSREKLEYDLYYAKNYTPFLDILILLQTIRVVLWPAGAR